MRVILISYLKEDVGYESSLSIQEMAYNEAVEYVARRLAKYNDGEFSNVIVTTWDSLRSAETTNMETNRGTDSISWPCFPEREKLFRNDVSIRLEDIHRAEWNKENKLRKEIEAVLVEKYQKEIDSLRTALDKAAKAFTEGK